jgi:hypothetical protein
MVEKSENPEKTTHLTSPKFIDKLSFQNIISTTSFNGEEFKKLKMPKGKPKQKKNRQCILKYDKRTRGV